MKYNKDLIVPLVFTIIIYLLCYQLPKIILDYNRLHYLYFEIDNIIPLFSQAILIYIGAFIQWLYVCFLMLKEDKKICYEFLNAMLIGSIIGFICFMVYPTGVIRPEIEVNNIFDKFIDLIYSVDSIANACPSFHCFVSTAVTIALYKTKNTKKSVLYFNIFFSILVYISTVLTKQHYIIDIPLGILLAFISYYLARYIKFDKLFDLLNKKRP